MTTRAANDRPARTANAGWKSLIWLAWLALTIGFCWLQDGGSARAAERSPCDLLAAKEVEAVLGGALAGPPFRATGANLTSNGESCRFETPDLRSIDLRVEWTDGGMIFGVTNGATEAIEDGLKGVLKLSDGTQLTGAWNDARVFMCCEFHALRGDQLVIIDISGSRATIAQAAALADAALRRLDQPLAVDDVAATKAAEERAAQRPQPRPVCEIVNRAEAEAIIGKALTAEPAGDEGSCTYAWTSAEGFELEFKLAVTWRRGFSEMRMTQAAIGQAVAALAFEDLNADATQDSDGPLFDEVAQTMIGTMAVRRDVLLGIETGGAASEIALALITAAAKKL